MLLKTRTPFSRRARPQLLLTTTVPAERDGGRIARWRLCSPFSVSRRLMYETAQLAERLDVRLHTHLAEDLDEDSYCLEQVRPLPASRVL